MVGVPNAQSLQNRMHSEFSGRTKRRKIAVRVENLLEEVRNSEISVEQDSFNHLSVSEEEDAYLSSSTELLSDTESYSTRRDRKSVV